MNKLGLSPRVEPDAFAQRDLGEEEQTEPNLFFNSTNVTYVAPLGSLYSANFVRRNLPALDELITQPGQCNSYNNSARSSGIHTMNSDYSESTEPSLSSESEQLISSLPNASLQSSSSIVSRTELPNSSLLSRAKVVRGKAPSLPSNTTSISQQETEWMGQKHSGHSQNHSMKPRNLDAVAPRHLSGHPSNFPSASARNENQSVTYVKGAPAQHFTAKPQPLSPVELDINTDLHPHSNTPSEKSNKGAYSAATDHKVQEFSVYERPSSSDFSSRSVEMSNHVATTDRGPYEEFTGVDGKIHRVYHKDIVITDEEIPIAYKEQYDIALLYAEDDIDDALAFKLFLERFCKTTEGESPKVCTVDCNPDMMEGSKIKHVEDAMEISTYVFLFITKTFCEDNWSALQKDEVLMAALGNPEKRWCIVPVLTQSRDEKDMSKAYRIPFGLMSLKPVDVYRVTLGQRFQDLMRDDPEDGAGEILTEFLINKRSKYFLQFMRQMMCKKLPIRKVREKQVVEKKADYIETEKRKRALAKARKLANDDAKLLALKSKKKEEEDKLKQLFENGDLGELREEAQSRYANGPVRQEKVVEGGTTYIYNFNGDISGANIPPMPAGKQTNVNVEQAGIMQVGDYNTATTLSREEEEDLYIPDIPQRRYNLSTGRAQDSSDDETETPMKQDQGLQEQYTRNTMMEQAKSAPNFEWLESQKDHTDKSVFMQHTSNNSPLSNSKASPELQMQCEEMVRIHSNSLMFQQRSSTRQCEEGSAGEEHNSSETEMENHLQEYGDSALTHQGSRGKHRSAARGSPVENENTDRLPKLYVYDENSAAPPPVSSNVGIIDNSQDGTVRNHELLGDADEELSKKSKYLRRIKSITNESDLSISNRFIEGEESPVPFQPQQQRSSKAMNTVNTTCQYSNSYPTISGNISGITEDIVDIEKKKAQSQFAKKYFEDLAGNNESVAPLESCDPSEIKKRQAESEVMKQHTNDSKQIGTASGDMRAQEKLPSMAKQSELLLPEANHEPRFIHQEQMPASTMFPVPYQPPKPTASEELAIRWLRNQYHPSIASASCQSDNSFDIESLKRYVEEENLDLDRRRGKKSHMSSENGESLNFNELKAFIKEQEMDKNGPRDSEKFRLDSNVGADGEEAMRWLIYLQKFPHHVHPQWVLGRSMTAPLTKNKETLPVPEDID